MDEISTDASAYLATVIQRDDTNSVLLRTLSSFLECAINVVSITRYEVLALSNQFTYVDKHNVL